MTIEQYWAEIHRMGLTQTNVPGIFRAADGSMHSVPNPAGHTPDQRAETIARLKFKMIG